MLVNLSLRSGGWFQFEVGNADDDAGVDGVRGSARVQLQIESIGAGCGGVDLATATSHSGGRDIMQMLQLIRRAGYRDEAQFEWGVVAIAFQRDRRRVRDQRKRDFWWS